MPSSLDKLSEQELLEYIATHDGQQAVKIVIKQFWQRYYGVLLIRLQRKFEPNLSKEDIEEELTDAYTYYFPVCLIKLSKTLDQNHQPVALLYKIAYNACLTRIKKQQRQSNIHHYQSFSIKIFENNDAQDVYFLPLVDYLDKYLSIDMNKEEILADKARLALGLLSDRQQQCLILRYINGYASEQIAEELAINLTQVRGGLQHGLARMRTLLDQHIVLSSNHHIIDDPALERIFAVIFRQTSKKIKKPSLQLLSLAMGFLSSKELLYFQQHHIEDVSVIQLIKKHRDAQITKTIKATENKIKLMLLAYVSTANF